MNVHERIWKSLNHEEPDRVPTFCQTIDPPIIQEYDEVYEIQDDYGMCKPDLAMAKEIGLDSKWNHSELVVWDEEARPKIPDEILKKFKNKRINHYGHVSERKPDGEVWYIDGVLKTPELIEQWIEYINSMEPGPDSHWDFVKEIWENGIKNEFLPIPTAGGPTYTTWASIGMDRVAYIMRKYPDLFKRLHRAHCELTLKMHNKLFERGIDIVFICDDHAFKDRCMFAPKHFKEIFIPNFKILTENAHEKGAKIIMHTDGFLEPEIEFLIEAGFDAVEPLEYEANNRLDRIKKRFGDKIALIGNIAGSDVLSVGTVKDTIRATLRALLDAAEGGGYILAPGSDIIPTVKLENVFAMIKTAKTFGTYPIDRERIENELKKL